MPCYLDARAKHKSSDKTKAYMKTYLKAYREKPENRASRAIRQKKLRSTPEGHIHHTLSARIRLALVNNTKSKKTIQYTGCDFSFLKQYLEKQFKKGMTWENYGMHGWHIDHIIPCALFDLSDNDQQKQCFHYSNLRPLWGVDNMNKKVKLLEPQLKLAV
jgi:hypothetical protein